MGAWGVITRVPPTFNWLSADEKRNLFIGTRTKAGQAALRWTPSPGADSYSVFRTTLYEDGVGGTYPLRMILLEDAATLSTFEDPTPTDGKIYSYHVVATNAAGSSVASTSVKAVPLPAPPATAPGSASGVWVKNRQGHGITLTPTRSRWSECQRGGFESRT